jgi:hypothetical protein
MSRTGEPPLQRAPRLRRPILAVQTRLPRLLRWAQYLLNGFSPNP